MAISDDGRNPVRNRPNPANPRSPLPQVGSAWQQYVSSNQGAYDRAGPRLSDREAYLRGLTMQASTPRNGSSPTAPRSPYSNYRPSGGGGGRGGGGGGGGGAPKPSQAEIDWIAGLLRGGRPAAQTATEFSGPAWQSYTPSAFDNSMYVDQRNQLNSAAEADRGTATGATAAMEAYLNQNYSNPYASAQPAQQIGLTQEGAADQFRAQGIDPSLMNKYVGAGDVARQQQMALVRQLAGAEDIAQRGRLTSNQQYGQDVQNRITAAVRGGMAGIGQQEGSARQDYARMVEEARRQDLMAQQQYAQQIAMANWQRPNQVSDTNATNQMGYNNNVLQALLSLYPQLMGSGLNLSGLGVQ